MDAILLLLENKHDKNLITTWLAGRYSILPENTPLETPFDLCIVDGPTLNRLKSDLKSRRGADEGVYLPFLLITSKRQVSLLTSSVWKIIDDVITTPIQIAEFNARLEVLLRSRRFSQQILDRREVLARHVRQRTEAEREKLLAAIEQTNDAIVITDPVGLIEYVNPAFERCTGYELAEILGKNPRILKSDQQDAVFYQDMWATLLEGRVWKGRLVNKRKDGGLYVEDSTISPIFDHEKKIVNFVAVKRDVTDQLKLVEEKEKLEQQFNQAQKMESVGRLAGGVAHDFNNMLTVIMGNAQLGLMSLDSGHPVCRALEDIDKVSKKAAALTSQLLAFARQQPISPRVLDLNEAVEGMLKILQRLIGENISLSWHPGAELWQIKVDPTQIDQILANLSVNARDAIKDIGSIDIETANCVVDDGQFATNLEAVPGDYVKLSLNDDGCGMDRETLAHIFEPFFTTKDLGKGTGLGLATVYGIVKQNLGFINIYSEPGKGTRFSIYLPRHVDSGSVHHQQAPVTPIPTGEETLLIVDDEPAVLEITSKMLESKGYNVIKASTPTDAIKLAHTHSGPIDLLITDVIMPEMNGRDLAQAMAEINPHVKCLFMSGYTADVIVRHGVAERGVHFVQKPFTLASIATKVREALDADR